MTAVLAGTVQAFQQPARQVLISDLVGDKHLLNAISLNSAAFNVSRSIGPAICGILIQDFGVDVSYYTQAGLCAAATLWTAQIRIPQSTTSFEDSSNVRSQSFFSSAKEGITYIVSQQLILTLMVLALAPIVLGMPFASLMPIFAIDVFHDGAKLQGLLLTMAGVGAVLGALAIASLRQRQGNGKLLITGAALFGLSLVLFSRSPIISIAMVSVLLAGFFGTSYNAQNQTIIQKLVPHELRGRVLGIYLLSNGLMPLGSLLAGALAHYLGGQWAVSIMGTSCFLLAIGIGLFVPSLRRLNLVQER